MMKRTIEPTIAQLRLLATIKGQAWGIRRDHIERFALEALDIPERAGLELTMDDFYDLRTPAHVASNGIAHIEVRGALMHSCRGVYEKLGFATRYSTIVAETEAVSAAGAIGVLYHVDSPGGTVAGNVEACDAISALGIPSVTHCSGLACSAAYKLAARTDRIIADPSAEVGNIGTIMTWADCDEFWREIGVEFKALTNKGADLKSTFHLEPDEAQLAFLQDRIDEMGAEFRKSVEKGRAAAGASLDDEVWRAGWYSGRKAGQLGLIDQIGTAKQAETLLIRLTRAEG